MLFRASSILRGSLKVDPEARRLPQDETRSSASGLRPYIEREACGKRGERNWKQSNIEEMEGAVAGSEALIRGPAQFVFTWAEFLRGASTFTQQVHLGIRGMRKLLSAALPGGW